MAAGPDPITTVALTWTRPEAEAAAWLGPEAEVLQTLADELAKRGLDGEGGAKLDVAVTDLTCKVRNEATCELQSIEVSVGRDGVPIRGSIT